MTAKRSKKVGEQPSASDELAVFRRRFAARLRELREERRLTREEVAARIGITKGHYDKLERGASWVADSTLENLRKTLRLDAVDFFIFKEANPDRHGLYELLRTAPEEVVLKARLLVLEELRRLGVVPHVAAGDHPGAAVGGGKR